MLLLLVASMLGMLVLTGNGYYQMNRVYQESQLMPQEVIPGIQSLETVTERFNTLNGLIWEHVTTQSDTQMSQIEGQIASAHQKLTESLTAYESVMSSQADMDLYQSDKEALGQFDALGSEVLTLSLGNEKG